MSVVIYLCNTLLPQAHTSLYPQTIAIYFFFMHNKFYFMGGVSVNTNQECLAGGTNSNTLNAIKTKSRNSVKNKKLTGNFLATFWCLTHKLIMASATKLVQLSKSAVSLSWFKKNLKKTLLTS